DAAHLSRRRVLLDLPLAAVLAEGRAREPDPLHDQRVPLRHAGLVGHPDRPGVRVDDHVRGRAVRRRALHAASRQRGPGLAVCGRFALFASPELVAEYFSLAEPPSIPAHYNVTPGQDIAAVRVDREGVRRLRALRWGLVPFWAKDPSIGRRMINARLDS